MHVAASYLIFIGPRSDYYQAAYPEYIYAQRQASSFHCVSSVTRKQNKRSVMAPNFGAPPVLEPGSLVLVTGANGFIGSHIADQLIQAGYRVRGTARDASKVGWLKDMFDKKYGPGKFESAVVEDMAKSGAYDDACKGTS